MTLIQPDKHAIYNNLGGGLGNQMFQYAFGLALATHKKARLYSGIYSLLRDKRRAYALNEFDIKTPIITKKLKKIRSIRHIIEPHFHYWHDVMNVPLPCRIEGYWQSERYFLAIEEQIRQTFDLSRFHNQDTQDPYRRIKQAQHSVGVHIRRGDYLRKVTIKYHGILQTDYYEKARTLMEQRYPNATFFVFSDEPDKAYQELRHWSRTQFIHQKNLYQDMMLLSACQHQIVANSSFSWWAAWLNRYPHKTIIAQQRWFLNKNLDTKDLIPAGWLKI